MKELNAKEIKSVSGGASVSDLVEGGITGAVGAGGFGASVGFAIGGPPGAAVIGGLGAGIGFLSGMVAVALR